MNEHTLADVLVTAAEVRILRRDQKVRQLGYDLRNCVFMKLPKDNVIFRDKIRRRWWSSSCLNAHAFVHVARLGQLCEQGEE